MQCPTCRGKKVNEQTGDACDACQGAGNISWVADTRKAHFAFEVCPSCNGSKRYWREKYPLYRVGRQLLDPEGKPLLTSKGLPRYEREFVRFHAQGDPKLDANGKPRFGKQGHQLFHAEKRVWENCACCVQCRGTGAHQVATVIPGQETESEAAEPVAEEFGPALSALGYLRDKQPTQHNALALLYGEDGVDAHATGLERDFALWHLTRTGASLCRSLPRNPRKALEDAHRAAEKGDEAAVARVTRMREDARWLASTARNALWKADQKTGARLFRAAEQQENEIGGRV
jgi:hypothetical protein